MNTTNMVIIGIIISLGLGLVIFFYYFRKHNIKKLFEQVYIASKQIPKQKKKSFLLLMFKESMSSKKKSIAAFEQLNNQKHLEIKLMQMSKILKNSSQNKDKSIKSALSLLNEYLAWEKAKKNISKKTS